MSHDRIIIVAPTRSTCVNLHHLIGLDSLPETLLTRERGPQLQSAIRDLPYGGFGIVSGTGTGKSAAIREICRRVLGVKLSVALVTLEHKAFKIDQHNVLVVTPGVAVMWATSGKITARDLVIYDEIHQTSDHLELAMALLKRLGCTSVWMSATIDPTVYYSYLSARTLIECHAFDPSRRAKVVNVGHDSAKRFLEDHLEDFAQRERGVALFVPRRADAEELSNEFDGKFGVHVSFYHGGEPAEKLRAFIEGTVRRPYVIIMTAAGASSLNIEGLDTVAIVNRQFTEIARGGKRRLVSQSLDGNTLLQMAGRVNGRALNGEIYFINQEPLNLDDIRPVAPSFLLGGDLELLAMTSARMGIAIDDLELIGAFDRYAYDAQFKRLVARGIIDASGTQPRLTEFGTRIQRLPVGVAWGEVVIKAQEFATAVGNPDFLPMVGLTSCTGDLYQLTRRDRWMRHLDPMVVSGSDHLTAYNIVAEALRSHGRKSEGGTYRLQGADFRQWCKDKGYMLKEIINTVMLFSTFCKQLGIELPDPQDFPTVKKGDDLHTLFVELLAGVQSMEYVHNTQHTTPSGIDTIVFGNEQYGVSYGRSVLGLIREWSDRNGRSRASISGTEIPMDVVTRYARRRFMSLQYVTDTDDGMMATASYELTFAGQVYGQEPSELSFDDLPERSKLNYRANPAWYTKTEPASSSYGSFLAPSW